ncbi:hypothetical protein BDR07DRAFT_1479339 [Suillus spraguei]|nr:hypothetical protein BDR07DRAFT_1479339 [Suillus spraguei]
MGCINSGAGIRDCVPACREQEEVVKSTTTTTELRCSRLQALDFIPGARSLSTRGTLLASFRLALAYPLPLVTISASSASLSSARSDSSTPAVPYTLQITGGHIQEVLIKYCRPVYNVSYSGVSHGTKLTWRYLVCVPVRVYGEQSTDVMQLKIMYWVNHFDSDEFVVSTGKCRKTCDLVCHGHEFAYKYG